MHVINFLYNIFLWLYVTVPFTFFPSGAPVIKSPRKIDIMRGTCPWCQHEPIEALSTRAYYAKYPPIYTITIPYYGKVSMCEEHILALKEGIEDALERE